MKIGVLADTHTTKGLKKLKKILSEYLFEVDLIIHVGDFISIEVVDLIREHNKLIGVWGNNDCQEVKTLLNETQVIDINGYAVGLFHGHGERGCTIERVLSKFKDVHVDIIIFGHSHQPIIMTRKNVLILNPGSPTNRRRERWFSLIVMTLEKDGLDVKLNLFTDLEQS